MLRMYKRKSGRDFAAQQSDLRNLMKVQPYWVGPTSKYGHKQKFDGVNKSCWCIQVDWHELGRTELSDEDFDANLRQPGQQEIFISSAEWTDPRKGDLFGLIESLESKQKEEK